MTLAETADQLKADPAVLRVYRERLPQLKQDGREFLSICPLHSDKTPSFTVYKHENIWLWKCFGCSKTGNIFMLLQELDSITFGEAVEKVRNTLGQNVPKEWKKVQEKSQAFSAIAPQNPKKTIKLSEHAKYESALAESPEAIAYLLKRGIALETAKTFHLGYRKSIVSCCPKFAQSHPEVADAGWISIPYIKGDLIVMDQFKSIVTSKESCRFPGMDTCMYNLDTIDWAEPVYVTEGALDAVVLEQAGFKACALYNATSSPTPEERDKLMEADHIILAGDSDAVGVQAMTKLHNELQEKTLYLKWPSGMKDANDVLVKQCGGDIEKFRLAVEDGVREARSSPIPGVVSLQQAMMDSGRVNLADHPNRLRFPWPQVDRMAILLPGSICYVSATDSKMGKTVWTTQATLHQAKEHHEVVVSWQCELSPSEFSEIAAAHVLRKSRNHLTKEDYQQAARILDGVQYYIGYDSMVTEINPALDIIEAAIRRLGATVVVLDHIHYLCENAKDPLKAQGAAIVRIVSMTGKYGVKFIIVGQPRKSDQNNRGKSRHMSDIKGASAIAQGVHAMFNIHREFIKTRDEDNPPSDTYEPKTEVHSMGIRAKGDGASSTFLMYLGEYATFVPVTNEKPPAGQNDLF